MTASQDTESASPRLDKVVTNAIGPELDHAMGYMNPVGTRAPGSDGTGYIATMKLSVATVHIGDLDEGTESIVSYDRCETADANIGQINMGTASSFCGLNGALWGYHLAHANLTAPPLVNTRDLFTPEEVAVLGEKGKRVTGVTGYSAGPLLEATERLFGHTKETERRHPPLPGAHVICANKNATVRGPAYAWAFIAIAIAQNPEQDSNLFIEDCGTIPVTLSGGTQKTIPTPEQVRQLLLDHRNAVLKSIDLCGQDYGNVVYGKAYIAGKAIYAGPDEVACALACAPYVLLAQNDIPKNLKATDLIEKKLEEWQALVWPKQTFTTSPTGQDGIYVLGPQK